ncbi:uncharacterized protein DS421_11g326480 [Arachis hypogaea]|nr:uncharacterized protein DS421_11g326480 [Arachis hypogaea]
MRSNDCSLFLQLATPSAPLPHRASVSFYHSLQRRRRSSSDLVSIATKSAPRLVNVLTFCAARPEMPKLNMTKDESFDDAPSRRVWSPPTQKALVHIHVGGRRRVPAKNDDEASGSA